MSIHVVRAIENRLTGVASIMLEHELPEQISLAQRHASQIARRIAQLGGAITHDPTRFTERAQLPALALPDDHADVDAVTEHLLISILTNKVAREDEIESALEHAASIA